MPIYPIEPAVGPLFPTPAAVRHRLCNLRVETRLLARLLRVAEDRSALLSAGPRSCAEGDGMGRASDHPEGGRAC